jgi:hypothetical protein
MPTSISSNFSFYSTDTINAGQTLTITNPGRTLRVISARIRGLGSGGAATVVLSKGNPGEIGITLGTGSVANAPTSGWVEITIASTSAAELTTANELRLAVSGGTLTGCIIECIGNPSQTVTSVVA